LGFTGQRLWEERAWLPRFASAVTRGRRWSVHPFVVIVHNFMSRHELNTSEGQDRLAACAFKVPVDGKMVSMCELNGTDMRESLNLRDQDRLVHVVAPVREAKP